jgi:bis(5'-nucleosyl)-tetraphosphatase (symmetrical)
MASYAIGDIQGCYQALQCLLEEINFSPNNDTLWFAGDLINRGPQSLETLRFVHALGDSAVVVLGNHDLHLLAINRDIRKPHKSDTVDEILNAPDKEELLNWLQQQKLIHHDAALGFTMVHAGIPPMWTLQQALLYAREVENKLRSNQADEYFAAMYGNSPSSWNEELVGPSRWRLITNYLTRMRYCTNAGDLDLVTKGSSPPDNKSFQPWFSHKYRLTLDNKIIFGHWAALQGVTNIANTYALDNGCVWGGKLTAMRLEDEALFSYDCKA